MENKDLKFGQLNDKIANVRDEITNFVGEMVKDNGSYQYGENRLCG